jgi:hypothetical protein
MSPQEIQLLFDYNSWANHRSLGAAEKLTPEQFTRPLGSSFSLAGALSRTFAVCVAGCRAILRRSESERTMAGTRSAPAGLRQRTNAIRPRPRDRVQDAQVRHPQQPTLAIDAARCESWDVPSRPGDNHVATAWSRAGFDRPDAFLP